MRTGKVNNVIKRSIVTVILLFVMNTALCEQAAWDCPECGRTGNTGNFCGKCMHPAPWNSLELKERIEELESQIADLTGKLTAAETARAEAEAKVVELTKHLEEVTASNSKGNTKSCLTTGDIISFGHYEQDSITSNGQEEIEWIVLDYDEKGNKALLLSKYGLDMKQYNTKSMDITWESCTLRIWLNDEFLNKAFSTAEQSVILTTNVDNSSDQGYNQWNTYGGNNTYDKIFLLSYAEANQYLGIDPVGRNNTKACVIPTAYAIAQKAWTNNSNQTTDGEPMGWWWLRSPGYYQYRAADVDDSGSLTNDNVRHDGNVVRPALWINLESDIF